MFTLIKICGESIEQGRKNHEAKEAIIAAGGTIEPTLLGMFLETLFFAIAKCVFVVLVVVTGGLFLWVLREVAYECWAWRWRRLRSEG